MSEIIFDRYTYRAKCTEENKKGEWIYGDLLRGPGECVGISDHGEISRAVCEVYPDTVGLCVGLPDKKGARLFEGDVLEDRSSAGTYRMLVKYGPQQNNFEQFGYANGGMGFYCEVIFPEEAYARNDIQFWASVGVCIGNAHDNPELLEVQDDE